MIVSPLEDKRRERETRKAADRLRHPAGSAFIVDGLPLINDPAATLTQLARSWERIHRDLTAGPGALPADDGYEALQVMAGALVHRTARAGLVLTWPQLQQAVARHDQVMDGDLTPDDLSCHTIAEALAKTCADVDWHLYPLIHGVPSIDACRDCIRVCQSVNVWQTRLGCTNHQTGRAL